MFRPVLGNALARKDGGKGGRPAYDAVLMFKILVLRAWYNLSDEQTEDQILACLSFMRFLGLELHDAVPEARTLWVFREKLIEAEAVERLFAQFDAKLNDSGFEASGGQIVDATLAFARAGLLSRSHVNVTVVTITTPIREWNQGSLSTALGIIISPGDADRMRAFLRKAGVIGDQGLDRAARRCWHQAKSRCAKPTAGKPSTKSHRVKSLTSPHNRVTFRRSRSRQDQFQHRLPRHPQHERKRSDQNTAKCSCERGAAHICRLFKCTPYSQ
jgi:IS5 family transposase